MSESRIDSDWPSEELEVVGACPYCGFTKRVLAHKNVQDWSFLCAPGKWMYWECVECRSLYLDPRPTKSSIGRAYATYYTHAPAWRDKVVAYAKSLIRNLCYQAWYGIKLRPRLPFPRFLHPALGVFRSRIAAPSFILMELHQLPRGRVVDVGCGDGLFLGLARQLGWQTLGIELDPKAVEALKTAGHEVVQGSYEALSSFRGELDCIICSHVLEHVHEPNALLQAMSRALKTGGEVLLTLPNAGSRVRAAVSDNWRGLEAPRHLVIPAFETLIERARLVGLEKKYSTLSRDETLTASIAIAQQRGLDNSSFHAALSRLPSGANALTETNADFINVVLTKVDGAHD